MDGSRLILEMGLRMGAKSETLASACVYLHRFLASVTESHDEHLVAATCLYLAGKVEEDHLRIRDIINVCHHLLNPKAEPMDLGPVYWSIRESIAQCELFLLRILEFGVNVDHPHRYLLHYLRSLSDWLNISPKEKVTLARVSWSLLTDFYLSKKCICYPPIPVSVATISLSLNILKIDVPRESEGSTKWIEALTGPDTDITQDLVNEIIRDLIGTYKPLMDDSPTESSPPVIQTLPFNS